MLRSLVGSEMCIRDRVGTIKIQHRVVWLPLGGMGTVPQCPGNGGSSLPITEGVLLPQPPKHEECPTEEQHLNTPKYSAHHGHNPWGGPLPRCEGSKGIEYPASPVGHNPHQGKDGKDEPHPCANEGYPCLLYTSDAADEEDSVDLGGRRIIKKKKNVKRKWYKSNKHY
eukprot:TRINITY_DN5296_c0_g1_i1.p1 TRINITY_DN5296_c0_g1~~TRINITY_DN5296_c0_g1_i1.p1  ORF type:complete len:169 (-),score=18.74 TRINITY_DN5296_c0_g1_i1:41-547(-)